MYKVIIVDDEQIILEGLKTRIKWNDLGFECVGVCENGREAIPLIEKLEPHLVITDIHMPFVNGLELIEYIRNNFNDMRILILSGYNDFEYLRKALNLGVDDYILKPITAAIMTDILKKLKQRLDLIQEKNREQKHMENLLYTEKADIVERLLNNLISGDIMNEIVIEKLASLEVVFTQESFLCAIIDVDEGYNKKIGLVEYSQEELPYFAVYNITNEIIFLKKLGVTFQNSDKKTVVIFQGETQNLQQNANTICSEIMNIVKENFEFTLTIGFGKIVSSIENICTSYKDATSALEYRFLYGGDTLIHADDAYVNIGRTLTNLSMIESKIITYMKTNDLENLSKSIKEMIEIIKENHLSIAKSYEVLQGFIFKMHQEIFELKIESKDIFKDKDNIFEEIYRYKTLDEIENWILMLCDSISKFLFKKREKYAYSLIENVEEYIKNNYGDENINIEMVSKLFSLSASYFSSLFKSYTGETFIEYLSRVRIEKAKTLLLSTNLRTYEIAEKVGYSDPHYFSIAFKKKTGVSPTAFKERGN